MLEDMARSNIKLQKMGIVHRNFKLANFVIDSNNKVRLIDFGSCYPNS